MTDSFPLWIGAGVLAAGSAVALLIPRKRRPAEVAELEPELVPQLEAA